MSMTLIKGTFRILKTAPDGDSVRFYPNNLQLWKKISTRIRTNRNGGTQLRLDSIDALETHYRPRGSVFGVVHQPLKYAHGAANELLNFLGFKEFSRNDNEVITASVPEEVTGYILTRSADAYGRCIAFVFAGETKLEDGGDIFFDDKLLKQTANYHLIEKGFAYPTFYSQLYPDIRQELTIAAQTAREKERGLWKLDKTNAGFKLENLETITDTVVILPKLFRRLLSYLALNDGSYELDGFLDFLESRGDRLIILPAGHVTGLDFVVSVEGQTLKLKHQPEELVFLEK